MSVLFGIRKPFGATVERKELLTLASATTRYAPDGVFLSAVGRIGMGFQPYHTTARSRLESQPAVDVHGNVLTFDGRLDNHADLRRQLNIAEAASDSTLVLAAFERWGEKCFAQLTGDWALALWSPHQQQTYLARDHAGTRTLYFRLSHGNLTWSTYLETFFVEGEQYPLDESYAVRLLCSLPTGDLTPYNDIRAVPPAHYLTIRENDVAANAHWSPPTGPTIHYETDSEYEEHFFSLLKQAVERRTASGDPILAQLSGGLDSTSIVCMSDYLRHANPRSPNELLDTLSYYDPREPHWDELPFIEITEKARGKTGYHADLSFMEGAFEPPDLSLGRPLLPGLDLRSSAHERLLLQLSANHGYRVTLSGIGGDELLGGVPTPMPELADHLLSMHARRLFQTSLAWCIVNRTSVLHTIVDTVRFSKQLYRPTNHPPGPVW